MEYDALCPPVFPGALESKSKSALVIIWFPIKVPLKKNYL